MNTKHLKFVKAGVFVILTTIPGYTQTMPTDSRLKDIAGSMMIGFHFSNISASTMAQTIVLREANAGQPTWYANWGGWNSAISFDFSTVNSDINWLYSNGKKVVVHMMVGDSMYLPLWLSNGTYTTAQLDTLLKSVIRSLVTSNSNNTKVDMWNVVNECVNNSGGWTRSKFLELGYENDASGLTGSDKVFSTAPVYVRKAFEYARLFTSKDLELRDYVNDGSRTESWIQTKTKAFYQLTKHLLAKGAPITAVGFQGHLDTAATYSFTGLTSQVKKFKNLGLKVYITEFDCIGLNSTLQANLMSNFTAAAIAGGVDGLFWWGVRDNQDQGWLYGKSALSFTENGSAKPSYYSIQKVLMDAAATKIGRGSADFTISSRNESNNNWKREDMIEQIDVSGRKVSCQSRGSALRTTGTLQGAGIRFILARDVQGQKIALPISVP